MLQDLVSENHVPTRCGCIVGLQQTQLDLDLVAVQERLHRTTDFEIEAGQLRFRPEQLPEQDQDAPVAEADVEHRRVFRQHRQSFLVAPGLQCPTDFLNEAPIRRIAVRFSGVVRLRIDLVCVPEAWTGSQVLVATFSAPDVRPGIRATGVLEIQPPADFA